MRLTPLSVLIPLLLIPVASSQAYDRVTGQEFASRSEVIATQAMAATSQPLATGHSDCAGCDETRW